MGEKKVDIWHNILWSRYKGGVFSALHNINDPEEFDIRFFQMAETEGNRQTLSGIDESYHTYPYTLLFKGALDLVDFKTRLREIIRVTKESNADLSVLSGYEKPEVWAQIALLKWRRKKIMMFCDSTAFDRPENFIKKMIKTIIFRSVDGVFGYGTRARAYTMSYGVSGDHWHKRCQAAALPHDYNTALVLQKRLKLAAPAEAPRFLYVGRLSQEKNLGRLLEAYAIVKRAIPAAQLMIVGGGLQQAALEKQAAELGFDPMQIFVGSKAGQDLYDEYAKATCFVLPSLSEPWGLVVNEALHYGCPVIVSDRCGCVPELVIEGETGFVHDPYSVDDLAKKMLKAVGQFNDTSKTALSCITHMQNYTSETAAIQILDGIRATLNR